MPTIRFEGHDYDCHAGESVLDALTRHGVLIPSGCRGGVCQACMLRCLSGEVPASSQGDIKDTLKAQNYFLACICKPEEDMEVGLSVTEKTPFTAIVIGKEQLNESIVRIRLSKPDGFEYRPGQFINVKHAESGSVRSYSLASIPAENFLELHIKRVAGGLVSSWLCDALAEGESIEFFGPVGDCFYISGREEQPLLMAGVGSGLAPLYGIVRDTLAAGHTGPIHLFHASLATPGLYLVDELRALAAEYDNLHYTPCVLNGDAPEGGVVGKIDKILADGKGSLGGYRSFMFSGYRAFLCGDPLTVEAIRRACFTGGVSMQDIYADPFESSAEG